MPDQFVISHNGLELPGMKAEEILSKLGKKELQPVDYVFIEEVQDWIMLADFQAYLEKHEPKSLAIPDQPPALSPYPLLSDEKKEKLLTQAPQSAIAPELKAEKNIKPEKSTHKQEPVQIPKTAFSPHKVSGVLELDEDIEEPTLIRIAPKSATPPVTDSSKKSTALQIKQGEALYSLSAEKAGQFVVKLKSQSHLDAGNTLEVKVKSGKPDKISWEGPSRKVVGESAGFQFFAKDQFENLVKSYSGEMSLKWQGDVTAPGKVQFSNGVGEVQVTTTKAQTLAFEILASSELPEVKLPPTAHVQFEAGPAEKLILEGPSEVMAGEPVQVKVRAVDKYGNLAKLDTEVEVEVTTRTA